MSDERSVLYQGAYFSLVADPIHAEFVRCGDETLVVALTDDDDVILTIEPSAAFPGPTVILPGGSTSPDLPHVETAQSRTAGGGRTAGRAASTSSASFGRSPST